jgi:hypothetical protein
MNLRLGEEDGTRVNFNVPGELSAVDHSNENNVGGQQGQLLRLAGWVDIDSRVTVSPVLLLFGTYSRNSGWLCGRAHLIPPTPARCYVPPGRPCCSLDVPCIDIGDVQPSRNHVCECQHTPLPANSRC